MVDKQLAKAIVDLALFLEFSPEDIVDQDAAVEAMEQLGNNLQLTSGDAQRMLAGHFRSLAADYGEYKEFVAGLADAFGLVQ